MINSQVLSIPKYLANRSSWYFPINSDLIIFSIYREPFQYSTLSILSPPFSSSNLLIYWAIRLSACRFDNHNLRTLNLACYGSFLVNLPLSIFQNGVSFGSTWVSKIKSWWRDGMLIVNCPWLGVVSDLQIIKNLRIITSKKFFLSLVS